MKLSKCTTLVITLAVAVPAFSASRFTVFLEESVVVPQPVLVRSRELASKMLADAGVEMEWRTCRRDECGSATDEPIVIGFQGRTSADTFPGALAFARPFEGVHINVFYDRVQKVREGMTQVGIAQVLAHVLVHEITHILQGLARHSESGIMKANWSGKDYTEMLWKPLSFTREDVELIQDGLAARARRALANQQSNRKAGTVK